MKQLPKRLLSIDVLRALTMLLMIFVNDASGVRHIAGWIDHAKGYEDAMGFADTIFPAFLFIMGLSIPLAIKNQIAKGNSRRQIFFHIITRGLALLIMGFYHVNMEDYSSAALLPRAVWEILLTISFFMIWLDYPKTMDRVKKNTIVGAGIVLLVALGILYRGGDATDPRWLEPSWWGILGIIGWSYLICALVYFLVKGKPAMLVVAYVIFAGLNIVYHTTKFHFQVMGLDDASSVTLTMGGVLISELYAYLVKTEKTNRLWLLFTIIGVGLIAAGLLVRPYAQGISKIRSTPAWVFICSGITVLMFEFFIYLVDIKGKINWFKIIRPAGTSTLTCYLIPYLQVAIFEILHVNYPEVFNNGTGGLIRSMATAFIIIIIGGFLEKRQLRLKI